MSDAFEEQWERNKRILQQKMDELREMVASSSVLGYRDPAKEALKKKAMEDFARIRESFKPRTTKFRFWGYAYNDLSGGCRMWHNEGDLFVHADSGMPYRCYGGSGYGDGWDISGEVEQLDFLIPMEWTGVSDDDGSELYEGDVVDTELGRARIGFQHGFFCLNWLEEDGSLSECNVELLGCTWKGRKREKLVLLGNVFENPELIGR